MTMLTNDHNGFTDASRGLKSVQQKLNASHFGNINRKFVRKLTELMLMDVR